MRQVGYLSDLDPPKAPGSAPQPFDERRGRHHPDPTGSGTPPAQAVAVYRDDGPDRYAEELGCDLGLPPGRTRVELATSEPDRPPTGPDRRARGLGIDHPDPRPADHQMVDIGPAAGNGEVVHHGPPAGRQTLEQRRRRLLAGGAPQPPLRIWAGPHDERSGRHSHGGAGQEDARRTRPV